jgi:predicted small integral membrane protein
MGISPSVAQMVGHMIVIRLAKVMIVGVLGVFALIVAYNNIVDYNSNYQFVKHVLSMDTTFPDNALMNRAISDERIWRAAYTLIIATEAATGVLLAIGAIALLGRLRAPAKLFNGAKGWAVAGLTIGFGLWFFGFIVVGGEYFLMWQSKLWNGEEGAFRIATVMIGALVLVGFPDGDLD